MNHIGLYVIYYCLIITYLAAMIEGGRDIYKQIKGKKGNIIPPSAPAAQDSDDYAIKWSLLAMFIITVVFGIFLGLLEAIMFWLGIR